jgi:hypothetical protein
LEKAIKEYKENANLRDEFWRVIDDEFMQNADFNENFTNDMWMEDEDEF